MKITHVYTHKHLKHFWATVKSQGIMKPKGGGGKKTVFNGNVEKRKDLV